MYICRGFGFGYVLTFDSAAAKNKKLFDNVNQLYLHLHFFNIYKYKFIFNITMLNYYIHYIYIYIIN